MELGYLTDRGQFVQIDTIGLRTFFPAYRIDPASGTLQFLTRISRLEPIADTHVVVALHRKGWGREGETFVRRSPARLHRTGACHILLGPSWRAIRTARRGDRTHVRYPFGSSTTKIKKTRGIAPPPRTSPLVAFLDDEAVKGCRRNGTRVEVFSLERSGLADFRIGKLKATFEFPTEATAEAFARGFPEVKNIEALDLATQVDVVRERGIVWNRLAIAIVAFMVAMYTFGIGFAAYTLVIGREDFFIRAIAGVWTFTFFAIWYMPDILWNLRRDLRDLIRRWEEIPARRWADNATERTAQFTGELPHLGLNVGPNMYGLSVLDRFFRALPPETYFHAYARDAGGFIGSAIVRHMYVDLEHEWRYLPDYRDVVLWIAPVEFWTAPATLLVKVWEGKQEKRLDEKAQEQVRMIETRFAFRDLTAFGALGFRESDWKGFEDFADLMSEYLEEEEPEERVLGDRRFQKRVVTFDEFETHYIEIEVSGDGEHSFRPYLAIPYCVQVQPVHADFHASAPTSADRDDVAVLHIQKREDPLAIQVLNYLDVGPRFTPNSGSFEIDLLAAASEAQVFTPRVLQSRPDLRESLAALGVDANGVPTVPYARFLGRIDAVAEMVNPFRDSELWRLELAIDGIPFHVLVRKDRCDGRPEPGHFLRGICWLVAEFPAKVADDTE